MKAELFTEEIEKSKTVETPPVRQMRLNRLALRNFKGIRDFTLKAEGRSLSVLGENASGKTSLADSFAYLLWGKDSSGSAAFEIKTLNENGEPLHGLEHEVEAEFEFDGRTKTFTRCLAEVWSKKRGSATREFTGHKGTFKIDGVPCTLGEFQAAIAELADERTFRLLTDPSFFSEGLHWQERRKILLEVCGDVSDADVIASDSRLADLPDILGSRSMEDHRKVIAAKRQEINRELTALPVRIDEASRNLPDPVANPKQLEQQIGKLRLQREEVTQEKSRIAAGGEVAEKRKRLAEISASMLEIETATRRDAADRYRDAVETTKNKLSDALNQIHSDELQITRHQREIENSQNRIQTLEGRMEELRQEWNELDATRMAQGTVATACAACGQDLPEDRVAEARQKAEEEFNAKKSRRLLQIREDGQKMGAEQAELRTAISRLQNDCDMLARQIEHDRERAEKLKSQVNDIPRPEEPRFPKEHAELAQERGQIELAISQLQQTAEPALAEAHKRLAELQTDIAELEKSLATVETRRKGEARIEELKAEEKRLAGEFEELERAQFLLDLFLKVKVDALTTRINSRFELARFKLFSELLNGGLEACCEVSYQGVPWGSLNTGSKINVGIDILNTLSDHYRFAPVVFIDGAESITSIRPARGQMVKLIVSSGDAKLRVEVE